MAEPLTLANAPQFLTVTQLCELLQCAYETGLGYIHHGFIEAVDVSASTSPRRRPVYRIPKVAVCEFLEGRRVDAVPAGKPRRQRVRPGDVIEFFS